MRIYLGRRLGRGFFAGVSVPLRLPRTLSGAVALFALGALLWLVIIWAKLSQ
jgi:hypothetical protein